MQYDYSKLEGKIKERYKTKTEFSIQLGITYPTLNDKLQNRRSWTQQQIEESCELLGIQAKDIPEYFFNHKVS